MARTLIVTCVLHRAGPNHEFDTDGERLVAGRLRRLGDKSMSLFIKNVYMPPRREYQPGPAILNVHNLMLFSCEVLLS